MKGLALASILAGCTLMALSGPQMPDFSEFDTNGNGVLTQTEFENAQQARMTKQAEAGRMMRNAGNAPTFKDIDADNNGVVTPTEFRNHQRTQMKKMNKQGSNMGQGQGMGKGMGQGKNQ